MKYTSIIDELGGATGNAWAVYRRAKQLMAEGHDIVEMAIGEPDVPTPDFIVDAAVESLRAGRTGYSPSLGEPGLRAALAERYRRHTNQAISADQIACFPGTQSALYTVMRAVAGPGDEVVLGDPMYATYGPVITACGARAVPVPLRADRRFRIDPAEVADAMTPTTTAILLNTPHNPTGAILTADDLAALAEVARDHDVWLIADEVYEELVFEGATFSSPLGISSIADRTIVLNSISKSHAAPGFRSGWCVASEEFCERVRPLSEAVLFGNQPFLADATAVAIAEASAAAAGMAKRFAARAERLASTLHEHSALRVIEPEAGMFALVDVSSTGLDGLSYAHHLLDHGGVGVMPGSSFGATLTDWVRVSLTRDDERFDEGCRRIVDHADSFG